MIIRRFPDLQWLKQRTGQLGNNPAEGWWPTKILEIETEGEERPDIKGPFSLFLNLEGSSAMAASGQWFRLPEHCYGISNAEEHYSLDYNTSQGARTFNIHFSRELAESIWTLYQAGTQEWLDGAVLTPLPLFRFGLRHKTLALEQRIQQIRKGYTDGEPDQLWLEQQLSGLIHLLFREELGMEKAIRDLPLKKKAWKEELALRLSRAALLMQSQPERNWSLEELAAAACLSRFHFLRSFRLVYGLTPHHFLLRERMERARRLLNKGKLLADIASELGFPEQSAFSRAFQRYFGIAPSKLR